MQAVVQKFESAQEFHEVAVLVHTLAKLKHPEALKALVPLVLGTLPLTGVASPGEDQSEAYQYLRLVTLTALRNTVREHAAAVSLVPDLNEMLLYARQKSES